MARQLDYFERACREEELPLLEEAYEKQKKEDKTYYDDNIKVFLEQHKKAYEMNLAEKARFTKILDEKDSFEASFMARRKEIYKKAKTEQEDRLKETIELRRKEREERRAEEALRKQEEEHLIKEKEEEETRLKREVEEREKLKEQKKKEEIERKSKLDAQAQLQRKREEEAIAKQKQQFEAVKKEEPKEPKEPKEPTPTSPVAEKSKEAWRHSKSIGTSSRDEKVDDRKWSESKERPSFERSVSMRARGEDRWDTPKRTTDGPRRYEEDRNVSGDRLPERTNEPYRPSDDRKWKHEDSEPRGSGSYRNDERPPGRDDYRKRTDERGPPPSSMDSGYHRPTPGDDRGPGRGNFERRSSERWGGSSGSRGAPAEEGDWKRDKSFHKSDEEHNFPSTRRPVDEARERGPPAVSRKPVAEEESAPVVKKPEEPMVRRDSKRDIDREGQSQSSKERTPTRGDSFRDKGPRNGDRPPERKREEKPAAPVEKEEEVDADGFQTVKKKKR